MKLSTLIFVFDVIENSVTPPLRAATKPQIINLQPYLHIFCIALHFALLILSILFYNFMHVQGE